MCRGITALTGGAPRRPNIKFADRPPVEDENGVCRQWWGLVVHFAKIHCAVSGLGFDDAVSELSERMLRAVRAYDPTRGVPLKNFLCLTLRQRTHRNKADRNHRNMKSLDSRDDADDGGHWQEAALQSDFPEPSDRMEREETEKQLWDAVRQLNEFQRPVIEGLLRGMTPEQLALGLNCTTANISIHKLAGLRQLRVLMGVNTI